jgi:nitrogen PTS system EIIA component
MVRRLQHPLCNCNSAPISPIIGHVHDAYRPRRAERGIPALKVNGKKQAIQELAARAAELTGQNEKAILEILLQREKLGSTAVGNGVAIPHGKLPKLGRLFGLFARLHKPIDFEALDGQPVDLIFLLLAPEAAGADHLKALARVARQLRDPEIARRLRESSDANAVYAVLAMPQASSAA